MARYQKAVVLDDTGVIPGTYLNANIVVNSKGQIISATSGSGGGGTGAAVLNDLTDVSVGGASANQYLKYDGSVWVPDTLSLNKLSNVNLTAPQAGEILSFDGLNWVNYDLSTAGLLLTTDLGSTVQSWSPKLENIATLDGQTGVLVQTGSNTFTKRAVTSTPNTGIAVTNGNGVSGDIEVAFDASSVLTENSFSPDDEIIFHSKASNQIRKTTVSNFSNNSGLVIDGMVRGSGAGVFVITLNGVMEFRSIDVAGGGLDIDTTSEMITIKLTEELESISLLTPYQDTFIVGNGSTWIGVPPSTARVSLGLSDIATRPSSDFLEVSGGSMLGDIDMGSKSITNVADPVNNKDAANKEYVDSQIAAGVDAGDGLVKIGNTLSVGQNIDESIIVNSNDIQLNTVFTDGRYPTISSLNSSVPGSEGANLIGTSTKTNLGNATTVEDALDYLNTSFSTPKFNLYLNFWNLDVGAPNVLQGRVRDVEVAVFEPNADTAIYTDFMLPPFFDRTKTMTVYTTWAKDTSDDGIVNLGLAYQRQQPGTNFPGRGPAPNMEFTLDDLEVFSDNDTLLHTVVWTLPANTFDPLDVVSLRLSRLGTLDTYNDKVNFFTAYIVQN